VTEAVQLAKVVQRLMRSGAYARALRLLDEVHPSDLAQLVPLLRPREVGLLFTEVLPLQVTGEVLEELSDKDLERTLSTQSDDRVAEILGRLDPPNAVALLDRLSTIRSEAILNHAPPELRSILERVLAYPPDTAGRAASPLLLALAPETTAEAAIELMRKTGVEDIWDLYVVEPSGQLVGILPLRRLLVAQPHVEVKELLVEAPVVIDAFAPVEDAARSCARYDLMAVPVVDEHHSLVGIITVDNVLDIVEDEATEALYGIAGLDRQLRVSSLLSEHLSSRIPWVMINLLTASMAALVVGSFEETIQKWAFLAAFMPVIAGMGGNMGTQTLTLITRGLALDDVSKALIWRIVGRQLLVGLTLGCAVGILMGLGAWLWQGQLLAITVFLAMIGNFIIGSLVGTIVPIAFDSLDRDPAVGSGVIVTAATDILGFLQFLALGAYFLSGS